MTVVSLAKLANVSCLQDVPASLRKLADSIEQSLKTVSDDHIIRCIVVIRESNKEPSVFAYGHIEHIEHMAQAYMDLHAGSDELMQMRHMERST